MIVRRQSEPRPTMSDHLVQKAVIGALVVLASQHAAAQDRPFVFSVTTAQETGKPQVLVDYDVGVGEHTFHSDAENGPEQRIGVQASLGRWTLLGRVGMTSAAGEYRASQQGEALFSLLTQRSNGVAFAAGGGLLREADGIDVALVRLVAGSDHEAWRLHGNLLFQKALAANRDGLDLVTTVGWAHRLTDAMSVGVETIGEDLEGFWDSTEAEGGARILAGPSFHIGSRRRAWQVSAAGGPMVHPADTGRSSGAVRDLPAQTVRLGYALRISFASHF
jgi:hypothetical protein